MILIILIVSLSIEMYGDTATSRPVTTEPVDLERTGRITFGQINESSGLVMSRKYPGVFWTHNDSGDLARIFPINGKGELVKPVFSPFYNGILVPKAVNTDWEDITADDEGTLYIGDIGNNDLERNVFSVYRVSEPSPFSPNDLPSSSEIRFRYTDGGTAVAHGVDAEALFWWDGELYLLGDNNSGSTSLFRLKIPRLKKLNSPESVHNAEHAGSFDFQARVTGADVSDSGRLAVLTSAAIWFFETSGKDEFFTNPRKLPIETGEYESIAFTGGSLLIGNEAGELFSLPVPGM
jgi:hypothetical protein